MKKVLFLFGAGASVPAGFPTSTGFTKALVECLSNSESPLGQFKWIPPLWSLLDNIAHGGNKETAQFFDTPPSFIPNFEQFSFLVEALEEFVEKSSSIDSVGLSLAKNLGFAALENKEEVLCTYLSSRLLSEVRE